jgi:hypothetical protein
MFGFIRRRQIERIEELLDFAERDVASLYKRMRLLEKRLGLTYNEGTKKKSHYKVAGKVGRPRKQ